MVRQRCYDIICRELSFDIFSDASRNFFAELAGALETMLFSSDQKHPVLVSLFFLAWWVLATKYGVYGLRDNKGV